MTNGEAEQQQQQQQERDRERISTGGSGGVGQFQFQMPVHYPRYSEMDYERMPEWQLDRLLSQYGLPVDGSVTHKRTFAIGTFLWH